MYFLAEINIASKKIFKILRNIFNKVYTIFELKYIMKLIIKRIWSC